MALHWSCEVVHYAYFCEYSETSRTISLKFGAILHTIFLRKGRIISNILSIQLHSHILKIVSFSTTGNKVVFHRIGLTMNYTFNRSHALQKKRKLSYTSLACMNESWFLQIHHQQLGFLISRAFFFSFFFVTSIWQELTYSDIFL